METVADALKRLLAPMFYDGGTDLGVYLESIGNPFQIVDDYASDTDAGEPGYSLWMDVNRVPGEIIPWLGQFVGVEVVRSLSIPDQKRQILTQGNWQRGTVASVRAAAQLFLTGGKSVTIKERDTSPYHFQLQVNYSELPPEDWPTTNLNPNGGFETNTTGWSAIGGSTLARDTTIARFGAASLLCTAGITAGGTAVIQSGYLPVTTNLPYSLSWYGRNKLGQRGVQAQIAWYTAGSAYVSQVNSPTYLLPSNDWQRVVIENVKAPATATQAIIYLVFAGSGATTDAVNMDGVQLEQQTQAAPYVETNGATASTQGQGLVRNAAANAKPAGLVMNYVVWQGQKAFTMRGSGLRGSPADVVRLYL